MKNLWGFALLLSVGSMALAGIDNDAVNERIPVNKKELEDHWQLDCAATWLGFQTVAATEGTNAHCWFNQELARDIKLCAFIYQAPGDTAQHTCPDYRGVSEYLEQVADPAGCPTLPAPIAQKLHCPEAGQ